jgi:hypothetical protein
MYLWRNILCKTINILHGRYYSFFQFNYPLLWGECNALFIIITCNACWLTNRVLAHTPPGTGVKVTLGNAWDVRCLMEQRCFGVTLGLGAMSAGTFCVMAGTPPGVMFCVCLWSENLVIGTANVVTGTRGWGASLSTPCSSWGVGCRISSIALCNFQMNALLLLVLSTFVVVDSNSLVSAFKWAVLLRLGTWQCWGKSSADPKTRHAHVSGTQYRLDW